MKKSDANHIAQRYVKALFDVSREASGVDAVEKDLNTLGALLHESEDFRQFLTNPLLSHAVRAEIMLTLLTKLNISQLTRQFIGMLIRQKRLGILPEVADLFSLWASQSRGELRGELVSALALKSQDVELISKRLSKAYGKTMKLQARQDPSLLGGVVVKIGSVELDGSLAGKLNRLNKILRVA